MIKAIFKRLNLIFPSSLFDVLGIEPTDNFGSVKKAYYQAALQHHPDKGGDVSQFQAMQAAWQQLDEPEKLSQYHRELQEGHVGPHTGFSMARATSSDTAAMSQGMSTNELSTGVEADIYIAVAVLPRRRGVTADEPRKAWPVLSSLRDEAINYEDFTHWLAHQELKQVGVTHEEAISAVAQHNRLSNYVVMRCKVPLQSLSFDRETFGQMHQSPASSSSHSKYQNSYFSLQANTQIHPTDILSLQGITYDDWLQHQPRGRAPTNKYGDGKDRILGGQDEIHRVWPHGTECVNNTMLRLEPCLKSLSCSERWTRNLDNTLLTAAYPRYP